MVEAFQRALLVPRKKSSPYFPSVTSVAYSSNSLLYMFFLLPVLTSNTLFTSASVSSAYIIVYALHASETFANAVGRLPSQNSLRTHEDFRNSGFSAARGKSLSLNDSTRSLMFADLAKCQVK